MKAILCKQPGPAHSLTIEDIPSPQVTGSGVKIRVHAAGLNFPDTLIIQGKYQIKPNFPFAPGGEMAGEVLEVGEKVTRFKAGDRVMGLTGYGAFAEEIVVAEQNLVALPQEMNYEQGAAFSMVYGTSYYALKQRANLQPGETLLVLGASGGVGLATVELGKAMGARVIACASSDEKLAIAKAAGADDLINYNKDDLKEAVKTLTKGQGANVIYDPVGGDYSEQALRAIAWEGRHLVIGFAAGDIPKMPLNLTLLKGCQIIGVFWGAFTMRDPQANYRNMLELLELFKQHKINPHISKRFAFHEYAAALNCLSERTATGKIVLNMPTQETL
ncbi:MAG: NADPH:quinone oxidoreductase family protein [Oceanospirillaceae bacterium]|nr:NADPH:quinone oxidoreductase family protein [Oceanospirillaceae bacterium]MCP5349568.1 NADPH:quinone oxidoreductase family protein [Oceanospirillaceae bacterium]